MSNQNQVSSLSLYHFQTCPYCAVTRKAIEQLALDIEHKDILLNRQHRSDLLSGGGKTQVPCLKIESKEGEVKWLYESADIIRYLRVYAEDLEAVAG